jgi:Tfp pilus assembly protein PilF
VAAKKKQLEKLEKGYQRVLKYQSPPWALRACYRMAELNQEFARFLKESPIPALSPEQKKQYVQLLDQKVQQYSKKADQYYQTCLQLAHKWEICDPKLIGYFSGSGTFENPDRQFQNFAGVRSGAGISVQSLKDPAIKQLHDQLMTQPDDMQLYLALADGYLKKGDYRQAAMIAQNALGKGKRNQKAVIAQLYNTLGVSWLYLGEDELAKDSFKQAMQLHGANMAASINLAGLYQFYGHSNKAKRLYANTKNINTNDPSHGRIHPRAGDLYNANYKISKN